MASVSNDLSYHPNTLFRNAHFNTVYASLFRKFPEVPYQRQRVITEDQDFLDIDWLKSGHKKLAFLCHGLEGSTESKYIRHLSLQLHEKGYDILAINYRSCSGEMNLGRKIYHSGATGDIHFLLKSYCLGYESIDLIGFSLGGNIVLKYAGEQGQGIFSNISSVTGISTPCDLESGAYELLKPINKIYSQRFLKTLKEKAKQKIKQHPDLFDIDSVLAAKSVMDFDDRFTGPVHGFEGALDYYRKCRSINFISEISIPCLILNALDDSFLAPSCYPFDQAKNNKEIELIVSKYGGHVGFTQYGKKLYWHEEKIHQFLDSVK